VHVQPAPTIPVRAYDGAALPYADRSFEVVLLSDVIHHAESPARLLAEALRVADRAVVVKDHFAFGAASRRLLLAMDLAANGFYGIAVRGAYLDPQGWLGLFEETGAVVADLVWPLDVHSAAFRLLAPSRLQFAARLERAA
jgi:SAM-dependent methyltransferase